MQSTQRNIPPECQDPSALVFCPKGTHGAPDPLPGSICPLLTSIVHPVCKTKGAAESTDVNHLSVLPEEGVYGWDSTGIGNVVGEHWPAISPLSLTTTAVLSGPPRVPKSCIFPPLQRKAWLSVAAGTKRKVDANGPQASQAHWPSSPSKVSLERFHQNCESSQISPRQARCPRNGGRAPSASLLVERLPIR